MSEMNVLQLAVSVLIGFAVFLSIKVVILNDEIAATKKRFDSYFTNLIGTLDAHQADCTLAYNAVMDRLEEGFESIEFKIEHGECDVELEVNEDLIEDDIHLISREEYHLSNIGYDHCALRYFPNSDRLEYRGDIDPEPFVVGNVEELIGDGLKYFGVRSYDENVVYVRNNNFKVDFKIERVS